MRFHFKIHKEKKGYWAECIEIPECSTQGENLDELQANMSEALNLLLDEPEYSKVIFPLPNNKLDGKKTVTAVKVDPTIAFAFLMRRYRLLKGLSQHQMKEILQYKNLFSYQKLESSKFANPTLKSLERIKEALPDFPFQLIL